MVHPIGSARTVANDGIMENINETPNPEEPSAEEPNPEETVESADSSHEYPTIDPDELLSEAAALKDPLYGESSTYGENVQDASHGPQYGFDERVAPTPPPPAFAETRLTRDPFATLGGVLSGIAHRYGWDVALTRIAFVVVFLISGGLALVAYALAWIIIPRAAIWPPAQRHVSQISGRDVGLGLLFVAAVVALGVSSGEFAGVLVPAALIGGGIYLLNQNPRPEQAHTFASSGVATAGAPTSAGVGASGGGTLPPADFSSPPPFSPQPVPKRSKRGIAVVAGLIVAVLAVPVVIVGGIAAVALVASDGGEWNFDSSKLTEYGFVTIDEIPNSISEESGELVVDLSAVDFSSIDTAEERIDLDINLDAGSVEIILPEDVRVNIDAEVDFAGEVQALDQESSGFRPDVAFNDDDPQLNLTVDVGVGQINVIRLPGS